MVKRSGAANSLSVRPAPNNLAALEGQVADIVPMVAVEAAVEAVGDEEAAAGVVVVMAIALPGKTEAADVVSAMEVEAVVAITIPPWIHLRIRNGIRRTIGIRARMTMTMIIDGIDKTLDRP